MLLNKNLKKLLSQPDSEEKKQIEDSFEVLSGDQREKPLLNIEFPAKFESSQDTLSRKDYKTETKL